MASRLSKQIIHKGQGVMACDILLRHCICKGVERRKEDKTRTPGVMSVRSER